MAKLSDKPVATIVIILVVMMFGGMFFVMNYIISIGNDRLNICAEEYGYKERTNWNSEGSLQLNYTTMDFNLTHIACCHRVKWIDDNGQIQDLNCTGAFPKN